MFRPNLAETRFFLSHELTADPAIGNAVPQRDILICRLPNVAPTPFRTPQRLCAPRTTASLRGWAGYRRWERLNHDDRRLGPGRIKAYTSMEIQALLYGDKEAEPKVPA